MNTKPILIIAGEPFGIFSEIFFKTLKKYKNKNPIILIGSLKLFLSQMKYLGYNHNFNLLFLNNFNLNDLKRNKINIFDVDFNFIKPFCEISDGSNNYIKKSFDLALSFIKKNKISGLINGPISKKNFLKGKYLGITEYLAKKTGAKNFAMLIYNQDLSVSPVTTHLPVREIHKHLNVNKLLMQIDLIKKFYKKTIKKDCSIGITGLNPHCESNYKNSEEKNIIIPAIKIAKKKYNKIYGPMSADSLFMINNRNKFNVVIGMYHDQVLGPIKSIYNFKAINITLGLPFIRISPDHGPNSAMQGKNKSDPSSLIEAIKFLDK